jgi:hypothetical protein
MLPSDLASTLRSSENRIQLFQGAGLQFVPTTALAHDLSKCIVVDVLLA